MIEKRCKMCKKLKSPLDSQGLCSGCNQPQHELEYHPKAVTPPKRPIYKPTTNFDLPKKDEGMSF